MVSRKDVAKRAGVSEATVSRVLNGLSVVKSDTRDRVLEAANALSYRPSAIAQSFARGTSGNIGVALPYLPKVHLFSTYYFAEICSGIGQALSKLGYHMLILFLQPDDTEQMVHAFETRKIDGCILLGTMSDSRLVETLRDAGYPVCLIGARHHRPDVLTVDANHVEGARTATTHLIHKGHTAIAFLNGPLGYSNSVDRLTGYQDALCDAGLTLHEGLVTYGNYSRTSGIKAAREIVRMRPRPTAVFAANDRMAAGLVVCFRELGIVVGQDIAVVGYDDGDTATLVDPPLTTVRVPFFEMGERAATAMIDLLAGRFAHQPDTRDTLHWVLPTELVVRTSCGTSRTATN